MLNTTVDLQDKLLPGLKLTLDATYKPETNAFAGKKNPYAVKKIYLKGRIKKAGSERSNPHC